jgi:CRP-like cAMP-binding protein
LTIIPRQDQAIALLLTGKTVTEVAEVVEVSRQTVSEWLHHHPGFQAALHQRQRELWQEASEQLRALIPKALEVVTQALEGEQALPAAVHGLKACGLYGGLAPSGPLDAADIALEQQRQRHARDLATLLVH